jgi:hypothetical protein
MQLYAGSGVGSEGLVGSGGRPGFLQPARSWVYVHTGQGRDEVVDVAVISSRPW